MKYAVFCCALFLADINLVGRGVHVIYCLITLWLLHRHQDSWIYSGFELSQWETTLHCNVVSHWLSPYPEWSLQSCVCPKANRIILYGIDKFGRSLAITTTTKFQLGSFYFTNMPYMGIILALLLFPRDFLPIIYEILSLLNRVMNIDVGTRISYGEYQ